MAVSFVAAATASGNGTSTSFTINKPTGTSTGNLMIASVTTYWEAATITGPSGWTRLTMTGSPWPDSCTVWYRIAQAGDPSSWTGTFGGSAANLYGYISQTTTYSGVNQTNPISAENGAYQGFQTNPTYTPSVSNSDPNGIWVAHFLQNDGLGGSSENWTSLSSGTERADNFNDPGTGVNYSAMAADSNGTISINSYQISASASTPDRQYSWLGMVSPASGTISSGDTGSGIESATIYIVGSDTAAGSESVSSLNSTVSGSDTGLGSEADSSNVILSDSDTGSGVEAVSFLTADVPGADTGSGTESGFSTATSSDSDTGSGAESASSSVTSSYAGRIGRMYVVPRDERLMYPERDNRTATCISDSDRILIA